MEWTRVCHQYSISVKPIFPQITGSMVAGVLLSELVSLLNEDLEWIQDIEKRPFIQISNVEIIISDDNLLRFCHLTKNEFKTAKKILTDINLISVQKMKNNLCLYTIQEIEISKAIEKFERKEGK